jgi:hypothetical protein
LRRNVFTQAGPIPVTQQQIFVPQVQTDGFSVIDQDKREQDGARHSASTQAVLLHDIKEAVQPNDVGFNYGTVGRGDHLRQAIIVLGAMFTLKGISEVGHPIRLGDA